MAREGQPKMELLKQLHARTWGVAQDINPNRVAPEEVQALAFAVFQTTRATMVTIEADPLTATMRATASPKLAMVDVVAASNCARGIMPTVIDWAIE